jgi:hypothetical protein
MKRISHNCVIGQFSPIMNKLVVTHHEDGKFTFSVNENSGYFISEEKISISIESDLDEDQDCVTEEMFFSLEKHPFSGTFNKGDTFSVIVPKSGEQNGVTKGWAYFGEHSSQVQIKLTVMEVKEGDEIVFQFEGLTDDMNYSGKKAKPQPSTGKFMLKKKEKISQLWNPS